MRFRSDFFWGRIEEKVSSDHCLVAFYGAFVDDVKEYRVLSIAAITEWKLFEDDEALLLYVHANP